MRIALIITTALLDQISKYLVLQSAVSQAPVRITPFMDFVLIWNEGISYGLLGAVQPSVLVVVSVLVCLLLGYFMTKSHSKLYAYGLAVIIGGAVGNIIDRLWHGAVVDFISLFVLDYRWYVFNVADVFITIGILMILADAIAEFRGRKQ